MRRLLILLAVLLAAGPARAYQETVSFGETPQLTVILEPPAARKGGWPVSGEIVLTIRVASKHAFEALTLDIPEIDGATVIRLVKPRTRVLRAYAGQGHVLETVLGIYPERSGTLVIPPIRASGRVEPEPGNEVEFADESPALTVGITGIDPAWGDAWWMVSRRVEIAETWSIPLDEVRDGDVVRREITITAAGVPHERMAVPEHGRTSGIEVADAGGTATTERTAEGVIGTVRHAWDLKMTGGRLLHVAPMSIAYWHPEKRARMTAALPGHRIEPLPPDSAALAAALMAEANAAHDGHLLLAALVLGVILAPFAALGAVTVWVALPTRADLRLRRACRAAGRPADIYRALVVWAAEGAMSLDDIAADARTPTYRALLAVLFGGRAGMLPGGPVSRELIRRGRRYRLGRLMAALGGLVDSLVGRRTSLARG